MASFDEPEEYGSRGRHEKGWMRDESGREYRLVSGGSVREYRTREDRDSAVNETYRLSPQALAIIGEKVESVAGAILANAVGLAELFWQESSTWTGALAERFDRWSALHFRRRLEPVARMVMLYEVKRRLSFGDGGHNGPPAGAFRDYAEQMRYERAAQAVPAGGESFKRVEAIAKMTGARIGPGPRPFPRQPNVEREANRQRAAIREELIAAERSPDGPWSDR